MLSLLAEDLDHVLERTSPLWERLRGAHVFVTGGTGFFGCWILESALWANERLRLGLELTVLARDYDRFLDKAPHLATHPRVRFVQGDVRSFSFPAGDFTHVIHLATDSTLKLTPENRALVSETIVEGTRRTLLFATMRGVRDFLFASSGAVYGPQPPNVPYVSEDFAGGEPASAYAEGKRVAEALCTSAVDVEPRIARCFAFVGPHLPLDAHFAIGNFIGDVLAGRPISIAGDGTPLRSYLYAADLAVWLWTILLAGRARVPYNVGSERAVSIEELARAVAATPGSTVEVALGKAPTPGVAPHRYVPSTHRARTELGLQDSFSLRESIERTVRYHRLQAQADLVLEGTKWQTLRSEARPSATAGRATSSLSSESTTTAA